jgi:hypothetical protein
MNVKPSTGAGDVAVDTVGVGANVCVARHWMGALATPMPMRAERSSFMVMIVGCWSRLFCNL